MIARNNNSLDDVDLLNVILLNPFYATGLSLNSMKTSAKPLVFQCFGGYRKKPVAWNEFIWDKTKLTIHLHQVYQSSCLSTTCQ